MDPNLLALLNQKVDQYERPEFIEPDPISIPHRYSSQPDIEIAALLASTIAWGNRKAIVDGGQRMMKMLGDAPHDFIMTASPAHIDALAAFTYRTFQKEDLPGFVRGLRAIYSTGDHALQNLFTPHPGETLRESIARFREAMIPHLATRTGKHLANPLAGAAAKRLCMFLRWMVRPANRGVDFGIWHSISPRQLVMPLDVHTARTGRALGLITRNSNDWRTATQLTQSLAEACPDDPVRYDFALFSIGIVEGGIDQ